jgi:bacterioferritin-associated ferredoxin
MIICSCNVITDHAVRDATSATDDSSGMSHVYRQIGCKPQCGRCRQTIKELVHSHRTRRKAEQERAG